VLIKVVAHKMKNGIRRDFIISQDFNPGVSLITLSLAGFYFLIYTVAAGHRKNVFPPLSHSQLHFPESPARYLRYSP